MRIDRVLELRNYIKKADWSSENFSIYGIPEYCTKVWPNDWEMVEFDSDRFGNSDMDYPDEFYEEPQPMTTGTQGNFDLATLRSLIKWFDTNDSDYLNVLDPQNKIDEYNGLTINKNSTAGEYVAYLDAFIANFDDWDDHDTCDEDGYGEDDDSSDGYYDNGLDHSEWDSWGRD